MLANRFTVAIDACSLFGALHRNLLLSFASDGFFRPRWSEQTLVELDKALSKRIGKINAQKQVASIKAAFPESVVELTDQAKARLTLPDEDDRHVLAAAIKVRASLIVTDNLKDFPDEVLNEFELESRSTDHFLADTVALNEVEAANSIRKMRKRLDRGALDPNALILKLEKIGLPETAAILTPFRQLI